jgi:hypothetical protein
MKKTVLISTVFAAMLACNNSVTENRGPNTKGQFPKPGNVIAETDIPVIEDTLNHFHFSVKVVADSNVQAGIYDVIAALGPNKVIGRFTLPKGAEDALPVIRKGASPYTSIIGFKLANDTVFNEYFEVSSDRKATRMRYIKAYTFESK